MSGSASNTSFINQRLNPIITNAAANHHIIKPTVQHHHGSPTLLPHRPLDIQNPINLT